MSYLDTDAVRRLARQALALVPASVIVVGTLHPAAGLIVPALVMGLAWKPRAWCAVCPVGALQDNIHARSAFAAPASKE